jgi:pimeloyl-ACP methyl ester carboxylesterase
MEMRKSLPTSNPVPPPGSSISISIDGGYLHGELQVPPASRGLVLFVHGSGSSSQSPRNQCVGEVIRQGGLATLHFDLLTHREEMEDRTTRRLSFAISLLANRLVTATQWTFGQPQLRGLPVGYFGASTGAAAALVAAAELGSQVSAVVCRGGRPDLARAALSKVVAPTLLIVGEADRGVLSLNEGALSQLHCERELKIIPGASHLFEEPGTLHQVAVCAVAWFSKHFESEHFGAAPPPEDFHRPGLNASPRRASSPTRAPNDSNRAP